ncbi:hypothetical protein E2562_038212 [Oryza meyeriana var. granulata]|uniref:C3H1-type domain-containing protein n=1 Tax=Oryza meyeriana var. granulata TaxID=110450 RepID=A0A6G1FGV2_9ORYZ|nr:hypothetical protein E2562_038212 [Oryza meyeriana var. granulata]
MLGPPRRGPAYKTKLCALWQRGNCNRDTCSFAHGHGDIRRPPASRSAFPHHPGRRDYRGGDFRGRIDRRFSPRRRHSPGREPRGHRPLYDRRPTSRERESSYSRSPSRKSERRHEKKTDDGETNSSRSLSLSDNNDERKKDKFSSGDEKEDHEKQLKQIRLDMETLCDDKTHLEVILDEKIDEVRKISSKVNDLEMLLRREKDECHRMTSKMKKFIKAHARFLKAQEEVKRSQARFERLGDLLASDILKRGANEEGSSVNVDEDPNGSYERSPNAAATKKRSIPHSTSEEAKAVKKRRERDSDTMARSDKYRPDGTDFDKASKGTEATKSLYLKKKLWEDEKSKLGANVFIDKVKDSPVKHVLPSTGMTAHAIDDINEAVELEDRHEPIDALLENDADDKTRSPIIPLQPLPVVQNAYEQYEGDDEEVDVE